MDNAAIGSSDHERITPCINERWYSDLVLYQTSLCLLSHHEHVLIFSHSFVKHHMISAFSNTATNNHETHADSEDSLDDTCMLLHMHPWMILISMYSIDVCTFYWCLWFILPAIFDSMLQCWFHTGRSVTLLQSEAADTNISVYMLLYQYGAL